MIFTSTVIAQASGALGGLVFSRNGGGPYIRTRATPTNPNTPQQQAIRGFLSQLTSLWVNSLTEDQRQGWTDYAANVPLINRIGQARNVTALNMYVRTNVPLLQGLFARQDDAPTIFDLGDFTAPFGFAVDATQVLTVSFTDTDDWVGENDAGMLIYISRQQNPSINFYKGPYQFAGSIDGDDTTPPTSPTTIPLPFPAVSGNIVFFRAQVIREDGRLSSDVKLRATVV